MSSGFSDKLKATGNKIKGEVTNAPKLQVEGKADKLKAAAQDKISDVKEAISNKLDCSDDTTS